MQNSQKVSIKLWLCDTVFGFRKMANTDIIFRYSKVMAHIPSEMGSLSTPHTWKHDYEKKKKKRTIGEKILNKKQQSIHPPKTKMT